MCRLLLVQLAFATAACAASADWNAWLNEDVHWLIGPEEKRQFLSLKSDQARERFQLDFWTKRDFVPNRAKRKYAERLQKANTLFAGAQPGYLTDRGHLFILYGRPNWISQDNGLVWHYYFIDGVGSNIDIPFVYDRAGQDWRLAMSDDEKSYLFYQPDPLSLQDSILLWKAAKRGQIRQGDGRNLR